MYVADIRSSRTFVFFRTGTAAWHRLVVVDDSWVNVLSLQMAIYIWDICWELRVGLSDAASMFIYMASRDFEKERRGIYIEASCK
jgi:hypothetical protein